MSIDHSRFHGLALILLVTAIAFEPRLTTRGQEVKAVSKPQAAPAADPVLGAIASYQSWTLMNPKPIAVNPQDAAEFG